jgi:hypothetical protein
MESIMEKLRRSSDPELDEIAQGLDRAIWWIDHKGAVLGGLSLAGLIPLLLVFYFIFTFL